MDLTIYDIIKGPILTSKAYKLNSKSKQLVVEVHMHANKPLIAEAVEKLFNVKVERVNTSIRKGKRRLTSTKHVTWGKAIKKAVVTLKEGYNIDSLGGQPGGEGATAAHNASAKRG